MVLVKDLNKDIFTSPFLKYLPETCESCGSPNEILETLNSLQCSNRHCISKVGYRLYSLLRDLGINYVTVDECINFLEEFDTLNPYSIFLYNPEDDGELISGFGEEKSLKLYSEINKKRGMLLWEYIKLGHFENLNVSAEKLLSKYNDINTFYQDLIEGGIPFIQNLLLEDTDYQDELGICVDAVIIYEVLIYYKEEIEECIDGVVILNPDKKVKILFANDVVGYFTNQDFLYSVNGKLRNQIYLYPAYKLGEDVSLVYWPDENIKVENSIIREVKLKYPNIKIVNEGNIFDKLLEVLSPNE